MLSVVRVEPNATGSIHSHPEEQWGVLLEGRCTRIQGGEEVEASVGDFWHTPGGVSHGIRTGSDGAVILDIFSPPRAEYKQKGQGFGRAIVKEN
jgi:quercetin dioxygenase-like cupin family protein